MIKKKDLSKKDIETWETYIKNPSDIYDKDNNKKNYNRKERFRFDLHGYTLDEANQRVRDIIFSCVKNKYKEINSQAEVHRMKSKTKNNSFS